MTLWFLMRPSVVGAGTMGLKGDLTAGEIVEQLLHAQRVTRIKNVVFMVCSHHFPLMPLNTWALCQTQYQLIVPLWHAVSLEQRQGGN